MVSCNTKSLHEFVLWTEPVNFLSEEKDGISEIQLSAAHTCAFNLAVSKTHIQVFLSFRIGVFGVSITVGSVAQSVLFLQQKINNKFKKNTT